MRHISLLAVLLIGCTNTTDKTLSSEVCMRSHVEIIAYPVVHSICNGKTCSTFTTMQMIPHTRCDSSFLMIEPNQDYVP